MLTLKNIQAIKRDIQRDLEAIQRVEALFASRRNGASHPTAAERVERVVPREPRPGERPGKGHLKSLVIKCLKENNGLRPVDVVRAVQSAGYPFKSAQGASASVNTALVRLRKCKAVDRRLGKYYWRSDLLPLESVTEAVFRG